MRLFFGFGFAFHLEAIWLHSVRRHHYEVRVQQLVTVLEISFMTNAGYVPPFSLKRILQIIQNMITDFIFKRDEN